MWLINERSIGTKGSESGRITIDLENSKGARISLEEEAHIAPFAITTGIYGLLMHTIFCSSQEEATQKISLLKGLIEKVLEASELEMGAELESTIEEIIQL